MDRDDDRIGRYPEADAWPEFEAVQSDPHDTPDLLIGQGIGRYNTAASRELEKITGNRRTILTGDQEYALALDLERGRRAKALIDEGGVDDTERALLLADIQTAERARERLILANLKLAAYFARASMNILTDEDREEGKMIGAYDDITKLASPHGSLEDRIGFANEGLIKAVDRFKPVVTPKTGKPVRFSTFAAYDIHGMLSRRIEQTEHGGIRPPSNFSDEISRLTRSDDEADTRKLARILTYKERIGTRISVDEMRAAVYDAESDNDAWDEHGRADIRDVYFDPEQPTTEALVNDRMLSKSLDSLLDSLSERESGIIRMRFGLPPYGREMTFDEIGRAYGVTRERIRQLEGRTIAKLRHPSRSKNLKGFLKETPHPLAYRDPLSLIDTDPLVDVVSPRVLRMGPPAPRPMMESWQTDPDEEWDDPVRCEVPETDDAAVDAAAADAFTEAFGLFKAVTSGEAPSYPAEALDMMTEAVGDALAARHVETLWNDVLPRILKRTPDHAVDPTAVSLFFAALLTREMRDDDAVYLKIPERLNARMDYFGYGFKHGTVTVDGDLGDYAGMQMGGLAALEVNGNVGNDAGNGMDGFAELRVAGNAGRRFGSGAETAVAICGGTIESTVFVPERPEKRPIKVRRSIARTALTAASLRARILAQTGILESLYALGDDASPRQIDVVSGRINDLAAELSRLEDERRDAGFLRGYFDDPV